MGYMYTIRQCTYKIVCRAIFCSSRKLSTDVNMYGRSLILLVSCVVLLTFVHHTKCSPLFLTQPKNANPQYMDLRRDILQGERNRRIGSSIVLNAAEEAVNRLLMNHKETEINSSRHTNGPPFLPSVNFLVGKPLIEKSSVFKLIKKMPKGGALHLHDCSMVDPHWLVKVVSYMPHCYICYDKNSIVHFHFFHAAPANPDCPWKLVSEERGKAADKDVFDKYLYNNMSMVVPDPKMAYPNLDAVWERLELVLDVANGLINYAPVFKLYFAQALAEFESDNVQYLETRGLFPVTYNLDGSTNPSSWAMEAYVNETKKYKQSHPEFSGARIIHSGLRFVNNSEVLKQVKQSVEYMKMYPDYFAGYDLVGQEDPGKPLIDYIDALLYPSQQNPPINLPYFFHAGETDWEGTFTDINLIDAVLLNTSRIGHGYAITKHPEVLKLVLQKNICLEINPISNQVLMLVDNLQNHPAAGLIAEGYPIVISSDDPAIWGASGLSYDFYMAFMGLAGKDADLRMLKQFAINSILFSSMGDNEKSAALSLWQFKWDKFINSALHENLLSSVMIGK